jgi:hypothetical protein
MSQKNIDFMKKNNYQSKKTLSTAPTDIEANNSIQKIISAQINATDTVVDAEMQTEMLTGVLDWSEGVSNDNLVRISTGKQISIKNINNDIINQPLDLSVPFIIGTENPNPPYFHKILAYDNKVVVAKQDGTIIYYDLYTEAWVLTGGMTNDGSAINNLELWDMIEYDEKLIICGGDTNNAYVAAYYDNAWHNYNSGDDYTNDGTAFGKDLAIASIATAMGIFNGDLIVGCYNGTICSYNKTRGWTDYEGKDEVGNTATSGIYLDRAYVGGAITSMTEFNGDLVFTAVQEIGVVFSVTTENVWTLASGNTVEGGPGGGIYNYAGDGYEMSVVYGTDLIFTGYAGRVSSVTVDNYWNLYDGTYKFYNSSSGIVETIAGPVGLGIYEVGLGSQDSTRAVFMYDNKLTFIDLQARIKYYDGASWTLAVDSTAGVAGDYIASGLISNSIGAALGYNGLIYILNITGLYSLDIQGDIRNIHLSEISSTTDFINLTMPGDSTFGEFVGGESIYSTVKYGDYQVFGMANGIIASYHTINDTWHTTTSGNGGVASTTVIGTNSVTNLQVMGTTLYVIGINAIGTYDGTNWKNYDGTGTGTGTYDNGTVLGGGINSTIVWDGNLLILAGNNGRVGCYSVANSLNHGYMTWEGIWSNGPIPVPETIYSNGSELANCTIYGIAKDTNRVVFAGSMPTEVIANWSPFTGWTDYQGFGAGEMPFGEQVEGIDSGTISKIISFGDNQFTFLNGLSQVAFSWDLSGWTLSDGTGGGTSPFYSDGTAHLSTGIRTIENAGGAFVIAGRYGRVSSHDGANWKLYDGTGTGSGPYNQVDNFNGEFDVSYHDGSRLIFGTSQGEVATVDFFSTWTFPDGTGGGTGVYNSAIIGSGIYTSRLSVVYDNKLIIANYRGDIAYYDYATELWVAYDSDTGPSNAGTVVGVLTGDAGIGQTTHGAIISMAVYNGMLIVGGRQGRIGSYDGTNWKNYDGTGTGTGPFNNQTVVGSSSIEVLVEFDGDLMIFGQNTLGSWNGTDFTNNSSAIVYNNNLVISDQMSGNIMSCDTTGAFRLHDGTGSGGLYYATTADHGQVPIINLMEYNGYLVSISLNDMASCDKGNNWTSKTGTGDDPTAYLYTSDYQNMSSAHPVRYDPSNPSFRFYQDKNNQFVGQAYTNLVVDPLDLTTSNWTKTNSTVTDSGETINGEILWKVTSIGGTQLLSCASIVPTANIGVYTFILRKGTADIYSVDFNSAVYNDAITITFSTKTVLTAAGATLLKEEWIDNTTVRVYIKTSTLSAINHILRFFNTETTAGDLVYISQPQFIDNTTTMFPFYDGTKPADVINKTFTMPDKFTIVWEGTPKMALTAGTVKIWSWYVSGTQRMYIGLTGGVFQLIWEDNDLLSFMNSDAFNGGAYGDLNQRLKVILSFDGSSGDINGSRLVVIPLESGMISEKTAFNVSPEIRSTTFQTLSIGNDGLGGAQADSNIESLRIYDGLFTDPITSNADADAIFGKEGILFPQEGGAIGNYDGNTFNQPGTYAINTYQVGLGDGNTLYGSTVNGKDNISIGENTLIIDTATGSFSDGNNKIIHK